MAATLILEICPSELWEDKFLFIGEMYLSYVISVVISHQVVVTYLLRQPQETNTVSKTKRQEAPFDQAAGQGAQRLALAQGHLSGPGTKLSASCPQITAL